MDSLSFSGIDAIQQIKKSIFIVIKPDEDILNLLYDKNYFFVYENEKLALQFNNLINGKYTYYRSRRTIGK